MIGVSVIMPSYLGEYLGSRKDPDKKFIRAVDSFLSNTLKEKELVIVSDGCKITNKIYEERYKQYDCIKLVKVEKREANWPGELRECGRALAKYEWICYLDTDDAFTESYLELVSKIITVNPNIKAFNSKYMLTPLLDVDYVIKNPSFLNLSIARTVEEYKELKEDANRGLRIKGLGIEWLVVGASRMAGTWMIIHHRDVNARWGNSDKMGEDKDFVLKVREECGDHRLPLYGYMICHITKSDADQSDGREHIVWEL